MPRGKACRAQLKEIKKGGKASAKAGGTGANADSLEELLDPIRREASSIAASLPLPHMRLSLQTRTTSTRRRSDTRAHAHACLHAQSHTSTHPRPHARAHTWRCRASDLVRCGFAQLKELKKTGGKSDGAAVRSHCRDRLSARLAHPHRHRNCAHIGAATRPRVRSAPEVLRSSGQAGFS